MPKNDKLDDRSEHATMPDEHPWLITHKPTYDSDFLNLPKNLQSNVIQAIAEFAKAPNRPQGDTIKPLRGWRNLWRYRLDDYRLIYCVAPEHRVVQLLAIGPRKDVYERFHYDPSAAVQLDAYTFGETLARALEPSHNMPPEWHNHPEWFRTPDQSRDAKRLPEKLTPSRLRRWLIPEQYHDLLLRCLTDEDLLKAPVPQDVLGKVMEALWPSDVVRIAAQPDLVLFRPQDLERYAEGALRGFLLRLDDDQKRFSDWAIIGPTLVKGGPGSGKSTVALYRVRALVEQAIQRNEAIPRILFTTYTNALIRYSQSLLHQLLRDALHLSDADELPSEITVTTVDKLVMKTVKEAQGSTGMADLSTQRRALQIAREFWRSQTPGESAGLQRSSTVEQVRDDYLLDEFDWVIEGQNCRSLEDYLAAQRVGRRIPFGAALRQAVWQVYQHYCKELASYHLVTWGQLRQRAFELIQKDTQHDTRWDYVVVDEAQDLTPTALAFCVELCSNAQGLFLTADANQSIYGRGFRWKDVHENLRVTGRTRELRRNYRSTREIAIAATDFLTSDSEVDWEAIRQEYVHSGAFPLVHAAEGSEDQALWLGLQIIDAAKELRLPIHSAAILVPSKALGRGIAENLNGLGLSTRFVESQDMNLAEHCVKVLTLHSAKGLEFPIVGLAHIEADRLPKERDIDNELEQVEYWASERRLLYVGCTRAMRFLFVTYDRGQPSPFLKDISTDHWMPI